ncbi:MAG: hypothetical protein WCO71_09065 [Pseudomonadota bacterium]
MVLVEQWHPVFASTSRRDVWKKNGLSNASERGGALQPATLEQLEQCRLCVGIVGTRERCRQGDQDPPFSTVVA